METPVAYELAFRNFVFVLAAAIGSFLNVCKSVPSIPPLHSAEVKAKNPGSASLKATPFSRRSSGRGFDWIEPLFLKHCGTVLTASRKFCPYTDPLLGCRWETRGHRLRLDSQRRDSSGSPVCSAPECQRATVGRPLSLPGEVLHLAKRRRLAAVRPNSVASCQVERRRFPG